MRSTGTGAVSILFSGFPYGDQNGICRMLSAVFFFLNLLLFVLFFAATITRYTRFPTTWSVMIRHPNESLSLGTFPMGAATLIGVGTTLLHGRYGFGGRKFVYTLWVLWWIDVALSILCCWGVIYAM
jgi:tellurite resistance protein TehA-like permease